MFESVDKLEEAIEEYFVSGVKIKKVVCGPPNRRYTEDVNVPTITGLALYLGFESRQSFYDYEKHPEFSYTIKKARLLIENEYEEQLQAGNTVGAIFALKNMGWKDKHEVEQSGVVTVRQYTGIENVVDDGPNK